MKSSIIKKSSNCCRPNTENERRKNDEKKKEREEGLLEEMPPAIVIIHDEFLSQGKSVFLSNCMGGIYNGGSQPTSIINSTIHDNNSTSDAEGSGDELEPRGSGVQTS